MVYERYQLGPHDEDDYAKFLQGWNGTKALGCHYAVHAMALVDLF
jgi:hypothetical protein